MQRTRGLKEKMFSKRHLHLFRMPCAELSYGAEQVAMLFQHASIRHEEKLVLLGKGASPTIRGT
jgi:hypothetical protein